AWVAQTSAADSSTETKEIKRGICAFQRCISGCRYNGRSPARHGPRRSAPAGHLLPKLREHQPCDRVLAIARLIDEHRLEVEHVLEPRIGRLVLEQQHHPRPFARPRAEMHAATRIDEQHAARPAQELDLM